MSQTGGIRLFFHNNLIIAPCSRRAWLQFRESRADWALPDHPEGALLYRVSTTGFCETRRGTARCWDTVRAPRGTALARVSQLKIMRPPGQAITIRNALMLSSIRIPIPTG